MCGQSTVLQKCKYWHRSSLQMGWVLSCMQIKVEAGTTDFVNVQLPQFGSTVFIHLAMLCNLQVFFLEPLPIALCFVSIVHIQTVGKTKASHTFTQRDHWKLYFRAAAALNTYRYTYRCTWDSASGMKVNSLYTQRGTSWHLQCLSDDTRHLRLWFSFSLTGEGVGHTAMLCKTLFFQPALTTVSTLMHSPQHFG